MRVNFKHKIIISLLISISFLVGATYLFKNEPEKPSHRTCLSNDEIATYEYESDRGGVARGTVKISISIRDQRSVIEKFTFRIENTSRASHALEMYKCNIYVIRVFNYDDARGVTLPDYRTELWQFHYDGNGRKLIDLFKKEGAPDNYGQDFRIDPFEKYIGLERKYFGHNNHALVIEDLNTKEDVYILSARSIEEQHPNIIGGFDMREWSKDGRYFWGDIFDGAYVLAYFRIDTQSWRTDIFETPDGTMGGFPLNINTGYVPIQPGQIWTGDYQLTQELKEQYRKEGKKSSFYLYNLFTKEKILVETTDEPLFSFKPKWLSDTELEYELPSGEKKVYKIDEK